MKTIFTSSYARRGNDPRAIAISVRPPSWYSGKHLPILAPTWELVTGIHRGEIDERQYTTKYLRLLQEERRLTPEIVAEMLPDQCILLCYESPFDFCHRHILANWVMIHIPTEIKFEEILTLDEKQTINQQKIVDSLLKF